MGAGQPAHVEIVKGSDNVAVTVVGSGDNRRSVDFPTRAGTYELLLHQTFRAVAPDPFSLSGQVD